MEEIILSDEQRVAYEAIENSRDNIFITGKAGTGKSWVLKYFRAHTALKYAVTAPTGIAAINVGGQTIHSLFSMQSSVQNPDDEESLKVSRAQAEILRNIDILIIDEVSMVRADVMDMIDAKLRLVRNMPLAPFGGCRIAAFGDLYQLPPVVGRDTGTEEYLEDRYGSAFFFAAPAVQSEPFRVIELSTVRRQSGDGDFTRVLNRVRVGENTPDIMKYLNTRVGQPADDLGIITLTPRKAAADAVNRAKLEALKAPETVYHGERSGDFQVEDMPTDLDLRLKQGAQVMLIRNDRDGRWVNGSIGTVSSLEPGYVSVDIDGNTYRVERETWQKTAYVYNRDTRTLEQKVTGSFTQYPVKPAYAITVHKSQGQTYDRVSIDYQSGGAFAPGQTYVALSRCKSLAGVYLPVPLAPEDISVNPEVTEFMNGRFRHEVRKISFDAKYITARPKDIPEVTWRPDGTISVKMTRSPKKLTGTRIAAALGRSRFKTPFTLWCELVRLWEKPFGGSPMTDAGSVIEPKQYEYTKNRLQDQARFSVSSPEDVFGPDPRQQTGFDFFQGDDVFGGMWDYLLMRDGERAAVFEMKTASVQKRRFWNDGVPGEYKLQAAFYAHLLGLKTCYIIPSFLEEDDYEHPEDYVCTDENTMLLRFSMDREFPDFDEKYMGPAREWYRRHVLEGISPPYDEELDREALDAIRRMCPQ